MGGVVSAVKDTVKSVGSAVGDVVSGTVEAVKDIGSSIDDNIIHPVAKAVDNTVQAAIDDPVNTAIRVAAFVVGGPPGLAAANAAIAVADGQSLEDAATVAAKTYVIAEAGQMAGAEAGSAASEAGATAEQAAMARGVTSGATRSGLSGGDIEQGAIMGGLGAASGIAGKSIADQQFEDWAHEEAAKAYDNAPSPTEQDVLAADPSIKMDFPLSTPTDATGPGYYDEITGEFIPSEYGPLQSPLTEASGTNLSSMDGYSTDGSIVTTPTGEQIDTSGTSSSGLPSSGDALLTPQATPTPSAYDPLLTRGQIAGGLNFAANAILNDASGSGQRTPVQSGLQSISNVQQQNARNAQTNWLGERNMIGDSTGDPFELAKLRQLYDTLTPEMQQTLSTNNGQKAPTYAFMQPEQSPLTMASGGSTTPWDELVKSAYTNASTKTNQPIFMGGGQRRVAQVTPLTQMSQGIAVRKAKGGLPELHGDIPKDHKPEFVTGHTGYYANGKGTGQSDDIPAVLQHGDFVVDADTVAALGDGSSKAGAQALEQFRKHIPVRAKSGGRAIPAQIADGEYVLPEAFVTALGQGDNARGAKMLDAMRHQIREHKRSAPTSKIPPKAKNPLEYIKMGTKG